MAKKENTVFYIVDDSKFVDLKGNCLPGQAVTEIVNCYNVFIPEEGSFTRAMGSRFTRDVADSIVGGEEYMSRALEEDLSKALVQSSSSLNLTDEEQEIDRWMNVGVSRTNVRALPPPTPRGNLNQPNRPQQPQMASASSSFSTTAWYCLLGIILPLFNLAYSSQWRCNPNLIVLSAELIFGCAGRAYTYLKNCISGYLTENNAREVFATIMDVLLVIYALGFLVLSLYQASIAHV